MPVVTGRFVGHYIHTGYTWKCLETQTSQGNFADKGTSYLQVFNFPEKLLIWKKLKKLCNEIRGTGRHTYFFSAIVAISHSLPVFQCMLGNFKETENGEFISERRESEVKLLWKRTLGKWRAIFLRSIFKSTFFLQKSVSLFTYLTVFLFRWKL